MSEDTSNLSGTAVKNVAELAIQSAEAQLLADDALGDGDQLFSVWHSKQADGTSKELWVRRKPKDVRIEVSSIDGLVQYVEQIKSDAAATQSVFVNEKSITLVLYGHNGPHENDARHIVSLDMEYTHEFNCLLHLQEKANGILPGDLNLAAETAIRECVPDGFAEMVSRVSFGGKSEESVESSRLKESMSSSVTMAVNKDVLPEKYQTLNVQLWQSHETRWRRPLTCYIRPLFLSKSWLFSPLNTKRFIEDNLTELVDAVRSAMPQSVAVYRGVFKA